MRIHTRIKIFDKSANYGLTPHDIVLSYDQMSGKASFPYKTIEMNWIGDFNPKMMRVCEQLISKIYKTHHTYRFLFDREKPFERHPIFD